MDDNREVVINSQKGLFDPVEAVGLVIGDYIIDSYENRNLYHATDNLFGTCEVFLGWNSLSRSFFVIPINSRTFLNMRRDFMGDFGLEKFTNELSPEQEAIWLY